MLACVGLESVGRIYLSNTSDEQPSRWPQVGLSTHSLAVLIRRVDIAFQLWNAVTEIYESLVLLPKHKHDLRWRWRGTHRDLPQGSSARPRQAVSAWSLKLCSPCWEQQLREGTDKEHKRLEWVNVAGSEGECAFTLRVGDSKGTTGEGTWAPTSLWTRVLKGKPENLLRLKENFPPRNWAVNQEDKEQGQKALLFASRGNPMRGATWWLES